MPDLPGHRDACVSGLKRLERVFMLYSFCDR